MGGIYLVPLVVEIMYRVQQLEKVREEAMSFIFINRFGDLLEKAFVTWHRKKGPRGVQLLLEAYLEKIKVKRMRIISFVCLDAFYEINLLEKNMVRIV